MQPIKFSYCNKIWAENQPPYQPLPAFVNKTETISCWQLTIRERVKLFLTGRLWLRQLNFGEPLQPQAPSVDTPFIR